MREGWGVGTWMVCGAAALGIVGLAACGDDARRPVGAVCSAAGQCDSGICGGSVCLDPAGDADSDGLINATEAALRTDPVSGDTDGDGVSDAEEVGADTTNPPDADGDGKIDAIESLTADCDGDEIVDQLDPTDGANADGTCGGGTVKVDLCPDICAATAALGCGEGWSEAACVQQCRGFGLELEDAGCAPEWQALARCALEAEKTCPTDGSSLPEIEEQTCLDEDLAVEACGGQGQCEEAEELDLGLRFSGQIPAGSSLAFVVAISPEEIYSVTVTPTTATDDPTVTIFRDDETRCAFEQGIPVTPLSRSDEPAGEAEALPFSHNGDSVVILVEAKDEAPLRFAIIVDVASDTQNP